MVAGKSGASGKGGTLRVLGIDPGTITTGWGVVEKGAGGRLVYVSDGEIKTPERAGLSEKLLVISLSLREVIKRTAPDVCAVESVFFARNVRSAVLLGHARGVAFLSAAEGGLPVYEYSPATVKQTVSSYGRADKAQVEKMVSLLLKKDGFTGPDAADALAVAICHIHHGVIARLSERQKAGLSG